jgi:hypothetical protein
MNRQVERANRLILQGMKTRMLYDLEVRDRNWHKELPSVLWALYTNINRAARDTPFNLVYEVDIVLPPEIYLESTRELDSNLLEERHNTALANIKKYQHSLKRYYNKSVV